jgi:hypothetical protein
VLRFARADGGLDLFDPLLERVHSLSADEVGELAHPPPALASRLDAALLLEGREAEALRASVWAARVLPLPDSPAVPPVADDSTRAIELPGALVAEAWRTPEAWRRIAEEHAAGREVLVLRGFFRPEAAATLAEAVAALPMDRVDTDRVQAWRRAVAPGQLGALRGLLLSEAFRALVGAALGVPLGEMLVANAWRMEPGDGMRAHPDGRRYAATWAVGLGDAWTADDGGAIAFGTPTADGFVVRERFLPFLGDVCLFVPDRRSWHVVEPPRRRTRLTVSGWWMR